MVLGVAGYLGAFMTAIYTFRMIFRAFHGEPCPEAEELSHGHLYHAPEPTNPMTGEVEDTEVGFPGPEHHIAEREVADEGRDGRARRAGDHRRLPADPGRDGRSCTTSSSRRSPTPSSTRTLEPIGARRSGSGSPIGARDRPRRHRHRLAHLRPRRQGGGDPGALRPRCTSFFVNKWYFDEAIDFLIVRPTAWLGRFANSTVERVFVNGALIGGSTGAVRTLSAAVRGLQSGYLRYYAALLLIGLTGLGAYFLIVRMNIHLSILIFFPLFCGVLSAFTPRGVAPTIMLIGDASCRSPTR